MKRAWSPFWPNTRYHELPIACHAPMSEPRIAFLASNSDDAQAQLAALTAHYGQCTPDEADILCPLGGDGFMLQTRRRLYAANPAPAFRTRDSGLRDEGRDGRFFDEPLSHR